MDTLRREIRMRRYRQFLLLSTELQDPGDPLSKYESHEFEEIYRWVFGSLEHDLILNPKAVDICAPILPYRWGE